MGGYLGGAKRLPVDSKPGHSAPHISVTVVKRPNVKIRVINAINACPSGVRVRVVKLSPCRAGGYSHAVYVNVLVSTLIHQTYVVISISQRPRGGCSGHSDEVPPLAISMIFDTIKRVVMREVVGMLIKNIISNNKLVCYSPAGAVGAR